MSPTATVTAVADPRAAPCSAAVTTTAVAPSASPTLVGFTDSVTPVETVSSSVSVNDAPVTVSPVAVPFTEIVSSPSTSKSCVGVKVNVPVPLVAFAPIVTVKSDTVA